MSLDDNDYFYLGVLLEGIQIKDIEYSQKMREVKIKRYNIIENI